MTANSANWGMWINVKNYGAKGDGVTNDYRNIVTAMHQVSSNPLGGALYFPRGNYLINESIKLTGVTVPIKILGDGDSSTITPAPGLSGGIANSGFVRPMFLLRGCKNTTFENIKLDANGCAQPPGESRTWNFIIQAGYSENLRFDNVTFDKAYTLSLSFASCSSVYVDNCRFYNGTCNFNANGHGHVTIYGGSVGCEWVDGFSSPFNHNFTNNYFEGYVRGGISCINYSGVAARGINITNNYFNSTSGRFFAVEFTQTPFDRAGKATTDALSSYINDIKINNNSFYYNFRGDVTQSSCGTGVSFAGANVTINDNTWTVNPAISGLTFFDSHRMGIEASGQNITINGNSMMGGQIHVTPERTDPAMRYSNTIISNNNVTWGSQYGAGGVAGIYIRTGQVLPNHSNLLISNNIISEPPGPIKNSQWRAIKLAAPFNDCIIDGNIIRGSVQQNIGSSAPTGGWSTGIEITPQTLGQKNLNIINNTLTELEFGIQLPQVLNRGTKPVGLDSYIIKNNTINCRKPTTFSPDTRQEIQYRLFTAGSIYLSGTNSTSNYTALLSVLSSSTAGVPSYFPLTGDIVGTGSLDTNKSRFQITRLGFTGDNSFITIGSNTIRISTYEVEVNPPVNIAGNNVYFLDVPTSNNGIIANNAFGFGTTLTANQLPLSSVVSSKSNITTENFAKWEQCALSETVYISAGQATSTTILPMLVRNSTIRCVGTKVKIPPVGPTTYSVGTVSNPTRFSSGISTAVTTKSVGLDHWPLSSVQATDEVLVITPNSTPTRPGTIEVTIFYEKFSPPEPVFW